MKFKTSDWVPIFDVSCFFSIFAAHNCYGGSSELRSLSEQWESGLAMTVTFCSLSLLYRQENVTILRATSPSDWARTWVKSATPHSSSASAWQRWNSWGFSLKIRAKVKVWRSKSSLPVQFHWLTVCWLSRMTFCKVWYLDKFKARQLPQATDESLCIQHYNWNVREVSIEKTRNTCGLLWPATLK